MTPTDLRRYAKEHRDLALDHAANVMDDAADELEAVLSALKGLLEACGYVSPIVGAVATEASVKHIRQAGKFIKACETAKTTIANVSTQHP
jgi:hypothetical protein